VQGTVLLEVKRPGNEADRQCSLQDVRVCARTGYEISEYRKLKCAQNLNSQKYKNKENMVVNLTKQNCPDCIDIYLHCKSQ
jgi:hypothetical protein